MAQEILAMRGINKHFGSVPVLVGVDFTLQQGSVHALVGGNGAGKSTLMKIMTGVYTLDSGEIRIAGQKVEIATPHSAREHGIAMIFQELSLIPTMTVSENIFLGEELRKYSFRDTKRMNQRAQELLNRLGIEIDPRAVVGKLSVGMNQMIEIAKAISKNARILVFDEPTASLSGAEADMLFQMIGDLKKQGISMVYISHRMNEIQKVADTITILRDGGVVHTGRVSDLSLESVISHVTGGGTATRGFEYVERPCAQDGGDLLRVQHLKVTERIQDISFSLKKGEILGFAGLMGSGRTEILETLFGIHKKKGGEVTLDGKRVDIATAGEGVRAGFALIPEDRRKQGLVLIHSVKENMILPKVHQLKKRGFLVDEKAANRLVEGKVKTLRIVTDRITKRVNQLSGGNQQKVVIGKWLEMNPRVLMLDEPTAGVDIGAKIEIIQLMREFTEKGNGVIFVSSELAEMLAVCDRIITLFDGCITGELQRSQIKGEEVLQYAIQQKA